MASDDIIFQQFVNIYSLSVFEKKTNFFPVQNGFSSEG